MTLATLQLLAQQTISTITPATGPTGAAPPPWFVALSNYGPIVLIVLFFWFFVSGSKRKQDRERKDLLGNLKKGDRIRLIGGEYGAVVDIKDARVLVKVDETSNTKIWYAREAVASVEVEEKEKVGGGQ